MRRQISLKHQNHDLNGRVTSFNFAKNPPSPIPPSPTFLLRLLFRFPALLYFRRASQGTFSRRPFDATTFFFSPLLLQHHTHNTPLLYLSSYLPNQQAREQQSHRNKNSNHVVHAQRSPKAQSQRARPTTRTSEMGSFGKTQGGSYIPPSCRLIITITIRLVVSKESYTQKKRQLE